MSRRSILFVGQFEPYPEPLFGGQIRVDRMLRELLQAFDVTFACTSVRAADDLRANWALAPRLTGILTGRRDDEAPERDPLWGSAFTLTKGLLPTTIPPLFRAPWSSALVASMRTLLLQHEIDAVWASRATAAEMARAAGATRIVVDIDDLQGELLRGRVEKTGRYKRRVFHQIAASRITAYERSLTTRFSQLVIGKESDRQFVERPVTPVGGTNVWVVPNGIDLSPLRRSAHAVVPNARAAPSILFVGALGYEPNYEASRWFAETVLPGIRERHPGTRFIVAGRGPVTASWMSTMQQCAVEVEITPPSLDAFYEQATVVVAPLQHGGGTSIKVLEAFSHGRPLVASTVAARGFDIRHGVHCLIADDAHDVINACLSLIDDPHQAERLGTAGRAFVESGHSWRAAGDVARSAVHAAIQSGLES